MAGKWPPECPDCGSAWGMSYTSDRTGNARKYSCRCGALFVAILRGLPSKSAVTEPKNVRQCDMVWTRMWKENVDGKCECNEC